MRLNHNILWVAATALCLDVVLAKIPIAGVFTGINAATGERPARRDITEMRNDVYAFSLYIQALAGMQARSETDQLSWFQVSGIHGRPYYAWDWVGNRPGAPQVGYCTHSDVLFMSWHRPYLALYEKVLVRHVQAIAKQYKTNTATWQRAADRFRIPYWDWAAPPYRMPDYFSTSTISVTTPTGVKTIANPLMQYKFKRNYPESSFPASNPLTSYKYTVRRPNGNRQSDPNTINAMLSAQAPSIAQQLYTVFSRATSYNNMATQSSAGPSFEGPHGWLHITVGGDGGHMTDVGYAGFDPIFLLHHTNVDRLGAMWQAIYPSSFLTPAKEGGGTWTLAPGQNIDAGTYLLPFHRADGKTPWTSNSARYTKTFGYSYPDVKDWLYTGSTGPSKLKAAVTARVNALYNLRAKTAKRDIRKRALEGKMESRAATAAMPDREWSIDMSAPNAALGGASFTVLLFLGAKPADPIMWIVESIGALYVLAQPMNAMSGPNALPSRTELVITEFLADRGIDTRDVEATKKYIDTNLIWGVQRADGSIVPNAQFKGLKILVEDDIVKPPVDDSQLPKYTDKTVHPDVTPVNPVNPAV